MTFPKFLDFYKVGSSRYLAFINAAAAELEGEFIGVISISSWTSLHKCFFGIWIEPKWRGPNAVAFGKQVLSYLHGTLNIRHVYGITPWNAAQQFASKIGMRSIMEIPNYCFIKEKIRDAEMFYSEYELCRLRLTNDLIHMGWMANAATQFANKMFGTGETAEHAAVGE